MKSCAEYEALISAFLDGELSGEERAKTAEHLASCPACQKYFDDLVAIHDALYQAEEAPVPAGFAGGVMDRVRETVQDEAKKVIPFPHWKRWAALAACCALAALGLWTFRSRGGEAGMSDQAVMARSAPAAQEAAVPEGLAEDGAAGEPDALTDDEAENAPEAKRESFYDDCGAAKSAEDQTPEPEQAYDAYGLEEPLPEPVMIAPAAMERQKTASGTIAAGGEAARSWVENELGLAWESGRTYPLTEEEFAGLLEALTEAGEDFRQEPGEGCRLVAE